MQRYDTTEIPNCAFGGEHIREADEGEYVLYTAAQSEIARLTGALEEAEANINLKADAIDRWTNTSAGQHQEIVELTAERDTARAETAMMVELAADASMSAGPSYFMTQTGCGFQEIHTKLGAFAFRTDIHDAIRALTPADAKAALAARDKAIREQTLREVAEVVRDEAMGISRAWCSDTCIELEGVILGMNEKASTGE